MSTNPFARFSRLIPTYPLRVGTVVSVAGTSLVVSELGGAQLRVIGEGTVGSKVYFRNGEVVSSAPSLTLEIVDE